MKRNVLEMVYNFVNGNEVDIETLRNEVNAEWTRVSAKQQANKTVYNEAHEVAMRIINDVPMTVKEIFAAGEDEWPDGFTVAKVQYAILHYWNDEIIKHDNGKSAFTYTKKSA